jgi:hypothetical protein
MYVSIPKSHDYKLFLIKDISDAEVIKVVGCLTQVSHST